MTTSMEDAFDSTTAAADPGSYGVAPSGHRLAGNIRLGPVHLQISDLARSVAFYEQTLGLRVVERGEVHATLAPQADLRTILVLHERAGAKPTRRRGQLGLYHFAILLPTRAALGGFVKHLGDIGARAGAGDHLVSEAFYLHDPDGLGIEVYADRPRSTWRRSDRELVMASNPVDVASLIAAAGDRPWGGMPAGTTIGHVHLHVGDLAAADAFYHRGLGLDRVAWSYPGALFLSSGGYHHHLGVNVWAGADAVPPALDDASLLEWTIEVPSAEALAAATLGLSDAGATVESTDGETVVRDPWGTMLRLRVGGDALSSAVPRAATS